MSTCGDCDCTDSSQCTKKGRPYGIEIIETPKSSTETIVEVAAVAENDGDCKCGAACACVSCTCGQ